MRQLPQTLPACLSTSLACMRLTPFGTGIVTDHPRDQQTQGRPSACRAGDPPSERLADLGFSMVGAA